MATNKVFQNPYNQKTQIWSTQGAKIYIPESLDANTGTFKEYSDSNNKNTLACIQGVTAQITRAVSDQYPLGAGSIIRLVGAPSGTASFTSLLGPLSNLRNFITKVCDVCNPCTIVIVPISQQTFGENCKNVTKPKTVTIALRGCTANSVQLSIQAAQQGLSLVNVPINVQFSDMTWTLK